MIFSRRLAVNFRRFHFGVRFVAGTTGRAARLIAVSKRASFRRRRSSMSFFTFRLLPKSWPLPPKFPPSKMVAEVPPERAGKIERLGPASIGWKRRAEKKKMHKINELHKVLAAENGP